MLRGKVAEGESFVVIGRCGLAVCIHLKDLIILAVKKPEHRKQTKYDTKWKIRSEPLIYIVKTEKQHRMVGGIHELRRQK